MRLMVGNQPMEIRDIIEQYFDNEEFMRYLFKTLHDRKDIPQFGNAYNELLLEFINYVKRNAYQIDPFYLGRLLYELKEDESITETIIGDIFASLPPAISERVQNIYATEVMKKLIGLQGATGEKGIEREETREKKREKKRRKSRWSLDENKKIFILAEKDDAARHMYEAFKQYLDPSLEEKKYELNGKTLTYYEGDKLIIFAASGHLIEMRPNVSHASLEDLPITDIKLYYPKSPRKGDTVFERLKLIKELAKKSKEIVIATDNDEEGEVIGYNIVVNYLKFPKYSRMYFNTLLPQELIYAFKTRGEIDETQLVRGLARNIADAIIGLNLTKALSLRFKQINNLRQNTSLGRVQSPVLDYIISSFVAGIVENKDNYTERSEVSGRLFIIDKNTGASYSSYTKPRKDELEDKVVNTEFIVEDIIEKERTEEQATFLPITKDFSMSSSFVYDDVLRKSFPVGGGKEFFKGIPAKVISQTLERMYLKGWISYPRTDRFEFPPSLLQQVVDTLKQYMKLPSSFDIWNSPSVKKFIEVHGERWKKIDELMRKSPEELVEEEITEEGKTRKGKTAISLLPDGIKAYFEGQMSDIERLVATFLLDRLIKTLAPPLKYKEISLVLREVPDEHGETKFLEPDEKWTISWSKKIENPEDSLKWVSMEIRPVPEKGARLHAIYIPSKSIRVSVEKRFETRKELLESDTDVVEWMIKNDLGTDATRETYVPKLIQMNYITPFLMGTILGKKVAQIIKHIGLTPETTREFKRRINRLTSLDELDDFIRETGEWTKQFLEKILELPDEMFLFKTPSGCILKVYQTSYGIYGVCEETGEKIKLVDTYNKTQ